MIRPASIIWFERLYLGSFALWVVGLVAFWTQFQHQIAVVAAHQPGAVAQIAGSIANGSLVLVAVVTLLLWYLVARRASNVAAWVVVVIEAFGALSVLFSLYHLATGQGPMQAQGYVNLVASLLSIAAAVCLLRPDARAWLDGSARPGPNIEVL